jgi:hypothetical protein
MSAERDKDGESGRWLSLMDYAMKKNLSLSTLRRYIKAKKIPYKLEGGRYFLWDDLPTPQPKAAMTDLQKAQEEIAELKTLIAYYEERLPKNLET